MLCAPHAGRTAPRARRSHTPLPVRHTGAARIARRHTAEVCNHCSPCLCCCQYCQWCWCWCSEGPWRRLCGVPPHKTHLACHTHPLRAPAIKCVKGGGIVSGQSSTTNHITIQQYNVRAVSRQQGVEFMIKQDDRLLTSWSCTVHITNHTKFYHTTPD